MRRPGVDHAPGRSRHGGGVSHRSGAGALGRRATTAAAGQAERTDPYGHAAARAMSPACEAVPCCCWPPAVWAVPRWSASMSSISASPRRAPNSPHAPTPRLTLITLERLTLPHEMLRLEL